MKLLHLADLHLGRRLAGFDLLEDQRHILEQAVDLCAARGVDAVVLAGDIYDTALPPAGAVTLLDWFLTELSRRGVAVLAVAGNHDSAERLDYAAGLLQEQRVFLAGQFTGAPRRVPLEDGYGPGEFGLLPVVPPDGGGRRGAAGLRGQRELRRRRERGHRAGGRRRPL